MNNCYICLETLNSDIETKYHKKCIKHLFGQIDLPEINFAKDEISEIAIKEINKRVSITGVQPKISLDYSPHDNKRLTIVSLWGKYILKPPHENYLQMPEVEAITMQMARTIGIEVADSGLIALKSGELAFIAKRFDREKKEKISVEDFCQLSEQLTEDKYNSSMEKVGKLVLKYTTIPGYEAIRLFKLTLFNFVLGNSDMHLKNFSLIRAKDGTIKLSPAYDLLSTQTLLPTDKEESALPINGKKHKLKKNDFEKFAQSLKITEKVVRNELDEFLHLFELNAMKLFAEQSLLQTEIRERFNSIVTQRLNVLKTIRM